MSEVACDALREFNAIKQGIRCARHEVRKKELRMRVKPQVPWGF